MNLTEIAVNLLVLSMLTTTWARTIMSNRDEKIHEDARQDDNTLKRYSNDDDYDGANPPTNRYKESEAFNEISIKKYARSEAEKLLRRGTRMSGKRRRSLHGIEDKVNLPYSTRRLEKMLEKAILKIITGDLSTADMLLLKSLNYSLEEVLSVREKEMKKKNSSNFDTYEPKMHNNLIEDKRSFTDPSRANQLETYDENTLTKKTEGATTTSSLSSNVKKSFERDFDFDAYNREAIYDYETAMNKMTSPSLDLDSIETSLDYENRANEATGITGFDDDAHENFDRANEPHVIFKIRYDNSEFDSNSNEGFKQLSRERKDRLATMDHHGSLDNDHRSNNKTVTSVSPTYEYSTSSEVNEATAGNGNKTFQTSTVLSSFPAVHRMDNFLTPYDHLNSAGGLDKSIESSARTATVEPDTSLDSSGTLTTVRTSGVSTPRLETPMVASAGANDSTSNETSDEPRRKSIYEGLEWVEDDVYRVIPGAIDSLSYYDASVNEMANDTIEDLEINGTRSSDFEGQIDDDNEADTVNDTIGYQNENPQDETNLPNVNLSTYQQLALAHRRDGNITSPFDSQGQKAIEDIKLKVLALTGRFNLSSGSNQVQRERLTMFSPICQLPRNTDAEAWSDPLSMNMNFHLNLTSDDHVVAAKVRIYVLPQNNTIATTGATTDAEDEEEKKIRVSIYFYTKSLKKHRSKKRLIDSVVLSLSAQGSHWALDVRQALRFWRQNVQNSHGLSSNHGLVIQVEDQDGRSLKPSQYIQQDSCHVTDQNEDEKAYQRVPALFVQACSRYVRVVNGEPVTYVNCRKNSRNARH